MANKRARSSRKADDTKNRYGADYTAHWTAINGLNSRLGNSSHQTYLGSVSQMSHFGNAGGGFSHTGVGTITGTPTDTEFNAVNTSLNSLIDGVNNLVTVFNALLAELQGSNFQA